MRLAILTGLLVAATPVPAATLHVPGEYPTIQAGLDASSAGDTVLVAPGTYSDWETRLGPNGVGISSCAHLSSGVTLLSESGPDVTILDLIAGSPFPTVVWGYNLAQEVRVQGFTITSPLQSQGILGAELWTCAKGTFQDCMFRELGSGGVGEKALVGTSNDLDVIGCKFIDIDGGTGAAISQGNAKLYVVDSWFENCQDAAIVCDSGSQSRSATIRNSVFLNNYASLGSGGAIYLASYSPVEISGCRFEGNVAAVSAGALENVNLGGSVSVLDNVFVSNDASGGRGGACWLTGASVTVDGNTFFQCTQAILGRGGAAMVLQGGVSGFSNNVVSECSGGTGAVRLESGTVTSDCNVFWANVGGDLDGVSYGSLDRVVDPEFCDANNGDLTVHQTSPCLPVNSQGCGQIGAKGQGCGPISVERTSWGRIKAGFR